MDKTIERFLSRFKTCDSGTGTDKLKPLLEENSIDYFGPFDSLVKAFNKAIDCTEKGDTVVLSPGCASFGMFLNEFDRGNQFRALVKKL